MLSLNFLNFRSWTDPESGVTSYLLDNQLGPIQQHFYYTNPSVSQDGRWFWITVAHPPGPARHLAAVSLDPSNPDVRPFPGAQFEQAEPGLDSDGASVLFGTANALWKITTEGDLNEVWRIPEEWLNGRKLLRLATHVSVAKDGAILLDGELATHSFVAFIPSSRDRWHLVDELQQRHDHAQWCPDHPNLFLIAHDVFRSPLTGKQLHHHLRTILMNREGTLYDPINPSFMASPYHGACHEWWSSGSTIAFIDYDSGVHEFDLESREISHLWKEPLCHAHSDASNRYLVADQSPYQWTSKPCQILHYDKVTEKRIVIASGLPLPPGGYEKSRSLYHIDPHPQFCGDFIVWTSTVEGRVTVALTPREDLTE